MVIYDICTDFLESVKLLPFIGAELEFYAIGEMPEINVFFVELLDKAKKANLNIGELKKESGPNQYEIIFNPSLDIVKLAEDIEKFRELASNIAAEHKLILSFGAKDFSNLPGSSMHVNINLLNSLGENIFARNEDNESEFMLYAIGGLIEVMPASLKYFAPIDECYLRYSKELEIQDQRKIIEVPKTISWGGNNRTVALRIPESSLREETRRIEHRVPCANANIEKTLLAIILGIKHGILNKIMPIYPKIFGNSFELQYNPVWLPQSLNEALEYKHDILLELE